MAIAIISKRCYKCKDFKPLSEFSKNQTTKDRLQNCCKSCQKIYCQTEQGKIVRRKAVKKHRQTERGKVTYLKAKKKYTQSEKGKAANQKSTLRYFARYPERRKAKDALACAIAAGKLPRANTLLCHYCPKPAQEYHHWHGYTPKHQLDIVPVCVKCHHNITLVKPYRLQKTMSIFDLL